MTLRRKYLFLLSFFSLLLVVSSSPVVADQAEPGPGTTGAEPDRSRAVTRAGRPAVATQASSPEQTVASLTDSLALDGSGDYVDVSDAADLRLGNVQEYTIEAWVHYKDTDCETIISKSYQDAYYLGICNGKIRYWSGGTQGAESNRTIPTEWTHIAVTWDQDGSYQYYINGEADASGAAGPSPSGSNSRPVYIGADPLPDANLYELNGGIAEVRLWSVARDVDDIRRTMHMALEEPRPGLIAAWHLAGDYRYQDAIGGHDGAPRGDASITGPKAPARPATVPVDTYFNSLPTATHEAAAAYLPFVDTGLLIGGERGGSVSDKIDFVELDTGDTRTVATLPAPREQAMAAYAPTQGSVYVFGGRDGGGNASDAIYAVPIGFGSPRTLSATLPVAEHSASAVYHPGADKIYIFGGYDPITFQTGKVFIFDPATETIIESSFEFNYHDMAATYSTATGKIYLFGGNPPGPDAVSDGIYEVAVGEDGSITSLDKLADVSLPNPVGKLPGIVNGRAVEDPHSNLIYLFGGGWNRALAFDPVTHQIWKTRVRLVGERSAPSVFYSKTNRHAVLLGGADGSDVKSGVWRIPLGDGPVMPLGHWDFPRPMNATVTAIDGDETTVAVATDGDGVRLFDEHNSWSDYDSSDFGTNNFSDARYNRVADRVWLGSDSGGHLIDLEGGSATSTYINDDTRSTDYKPFGFELNRDYSYFYGTTSGLKWAVPGSSITNFPGSTIWSIAHRGLGDLWALVDNNLNHLDYDAYDGSNTESSYGRPCYDPTAVTQYGNPNEVVLDDRNNWWIAIGGMPASGGEDIYAEQGGICYIPAASTPQSENFFIPTMGDTDGNPLASTDAGSDATAITVDADNRVWVAINDMESSNSYAPNDEGGLVAYQAINSASANAADHVRTEEFDWRKMPLADGGFSAVGAADERVWAGKADGTLVTLAQRWWRLGESNNIEDRNLQDIWTVRGRAFLATLTDLYILMPDGKSWEQRTVTVHDVLGDRQGRIWVATDDDVRLYTANGWDTLDDVVGAPPSGPVQALAEDENGRIWIGSDSGLTLFDRGRFVGTFTDANSGLPSDNVQALLVDAQDNLWVATDAGLARRNAQGWSTWTAADGLPSNILLDLAPAQGGTIAISTYSPSEVVFFDGSSFSQYTPPLPTSWARIPLTTDDRGRPWAASSVWTGGSWQSYYPTNSGLSHFSVSGVAADRAERVWFVHGSGSGVSIRGTRLPPLADVQPTISGLAPDEGSAGDTITIQGSGFGSNKNRASVTVGGAPVEIESISNSEIEVRLNEKNRSGGVSVSVDGRRVTLTGNDSRRAFCAVPVIDKFNPIGGNNGVTVDINGSNFDTSALVALGGGADRAPRTAFSDATHLQVGIRPGDSNGKVTVKNDCDGVTGDSAVTFRHYTPKITDVVLNQGASSLFHVSDKPTMVQVYLSTDQPLRSRPEASDRLRIDEVEVTFGSGNNQETYSVPYTLGNVPSHAGGPSAADLKSIDEGIHVEITPRIEDVLEQEGTMPPVTVTLRKDAGIETEYEIAQKTIQGPETFFAPNIPMHVLLVPIMSNLSGPSHVNDMKREVNGELQHLQERIWPTGRVETHWSPMYFTVREVLPGDKTEVNIGNFLQLYHASHKLEKARQAWNANHDPNAIIALGIVEGQVATGASGKAFWPNVSRMVNVLQLKKFDTLCDAGNAVVRVVTLGAAGSEDGCHLEVPIYVGWASAASHVPASETFAHEMGHTMGLVSVIASNTDPGNLSHSRNDEIQGGEFSDLIDGNASYDRSKTYYMQPGVEEPIVDPLNGRQFLPRLGEVMTGTYDGTTITNGAVVARAKSIMAYGLERQNNNVFFEPVDVVRIYREQGMASMTQFIRNLEDGGPAAATTAASLSPTQPADGPTPITIPGDRLFISGLINRATMTGTLEHVEAAGENAPLSPGFDTGYTLVQLDAGGAELDRLGIFPVFRSTGDTTEHDTGFFDATLLLHDNVSQVELRSGETVLDSFSAGSTAPVISISSPAGGGNYNSGTVPVAWSASDPDGDPLQVAVAYSADNGATWTTMAFAQGSGAADLPVAQLAGSSSARIRVTATDGFHTASATSNAFSVADQPPRPYIGAPAPGSTFLEGERVQLRGGADDNQDGSVADGDLHWRSDRDGDLGAGSELAAVLSVGQHRLTLEAENSAGLAATAQVTLTVRGDYDYDGIPDDEELGAGLNPLAWADARSDGDGDGLSRLVERQRGTDPAVADSDGDGRNDGQEVAEGTDPITKDSAPGPDSLRVVPDSLTFEADLARDIPLPQQQVEILSRQPASWTLSADVGWLGASAASGRTPAGPTILVDAFELADGTHTGKLTFASAELGSSVEVPVVVTVTNSAAHFDTNGDGGLNIGDVQTVAGDIPSSNAEAGFDYRQDVDRDGDVDAGDARQVARRWPTDHVCCPVAYPGSGAKVTATPPVQMAAGETITVPVMVEDASALGGFELALRYNDAVLQFRDASLGGFLGRSGRTTAALDPITQAAGEVTMGGYSYGSQNGASGDGTLISLRFEVVQAGSAQVVLEDVLLADPDGAVHRPTATSGNTLYLPFLSIR